MPQNCSADVTAVIALVDSVLDAGNTTEIEELKEFFGLGNLTRAADFAHARKRVLFIYANYKLNHTIKYLTL